VTHQLKISVTEGEVVTVTGIHRKAAIRLLRRAPRPSTSRPRSGRPRLYGPAVAAAGQVLWEAAGRIGPQRLHPFVPELLEHRGLLPLRLPMPLLGLDSDNGSEFINQSLYGYCQREGITFTRSRAWKKNDSAHVAMP
jgi:hypothetical protein